MPGFLPPPTPIRPVDSPSNPGFPAIPGSPDSSTGFPSQSSGKIDWPWDYPEPKAENTENMCEVVPSNNNNEDPDDKDCELLFALAQAKWGLARAILVYTLCIADDGNMGG